MPSNLVINKDSVVGYNNKLQRATQDMKPGINNVNKETTKGIPHFEEPAKKVHTPVKKEAVNKSEVKKEAVHKVYKEETYDHNLLKPGLMLLAIGLGYYILN